MAPQYDVSPERKAVLEDNARRRLALRNEFLKKHSNPFVQPGENAGAVYDPALYRYQALKVSAFEHFKPSVKNSAFFFGVVILPIIGYTYYLIKASDAREKTYRSGEVAYKDRKFKLI